MEEIKICLINSSNKYLWCLCYMWALFQVLGDQHETKQKNPPPSWSSYSYEETQIINK